jgi:predicted RNase H-like nuclease (RuvC/YqgF family)
MDSSLTSVYHLASLQQQKDEEIAGLRACGHQTEPERAALCGRLDQYNAENAELLARVQQTEPERAVLRGRLDQFMAEKAELLARIERLDTEMAARAEEAQHAAQLAFEVRTLSSELHNSACMYTLRLNACAVDTSIQHVYVSV